MAYATLDDMLAAFGEAELVRLSDAAGTGAVDTATVQRALDDASAEVDAHLAVRYPTPLAPVPDVVRRLTCDMARWYLASSADLASEHIRQRYDDAKALLRALARGDATLGAQADAPAPAPDDVPKVDAPQRVFDEQTLREFG